LFLVPALLLADAGPASASIVRALSLPQLVDEASVVAVVAVESASSSWVDGRIVTDTVTVVVDGLGGVSTGARLTLRTLGGEVDGIGQRVFGEAWFRPGERYLVFLEPALPSSAVAGPLPELLRPVGMSQGALPVVDGVDGPMVAPSPELPALVGADAALPADAWLEVPRPLADVSAEVRALLPAGERR
jgi:hypothetical protein